MRRQPGARLTRCLAQRPPPSAPPPLPTTLSGRLCTNEETEARGHLSHTTNSCRAWIPTQTGSCVDTLDGPTQSWRQKAPHVKEEDLRKHGRRYIHSRPPLKSPACPKGAAANRPHASPQPWSLVIQSFFMQCGVSWGPTRGAPDDAASSYGAAGV